MKYAAAFLCILFFLLGKIALAENFPVQQKQIIHQQELLRLLPDSLSQSERDTVKTSHENKRLIAALLAFPLPFGVLGLHRIYLGTDAWVPVAYFVTLGGFGVLSLIDFIYIITTTDEEFEALSHNGKLFVWVK